MHRRHHAQRQHIIHSLDTTLYQLHTLSFFLSPSLWSYLCRIFAQFQCSKPRDLDATRSLRFFFVIVFTLNLPSLWLHALHRPGEGRSIILDFIGMCTSTHAYKDFMLKGYDQRIRRRNSLCFPLTHSFSSCNGSLSRSRTRRRFLGKSQRPSKTCSSHFPHHLYHQLSHRPLPLHRHHPFLADCLIIRKRYIPQTLHQTSLTSAFMLS